MQISPIQNLPVLNLPQAKAASSKRIHWPLEVAPLLNFDWQQRVITVIDQAEARLDKLVPNRSLQNDFDAMCRAISQNNTNSEFNAWLDTNGHGEWYKQLATYLAKLPLRAARNIMRLIFNFIKIAVSIPAYTLMHPMKAPLKLAKILVALAHALMQPETWSRIGSGLVGTSLGMATISGGALGVISLGIGGAMIVGGVSLGALKTTLVAQKGSRWHDAKAYLAKQAQQLPEDMMTSFCTVMLLEGMHQIMRGFQKMSHNAKHARAVNASRKTFAQDKADQIYRENGLVGDYRLGTRGDTLTMTWHNRDFMAYKLPNNLPGGNYFKESVHTDTKWVTKWVYNHSREQWQAVRRAKYIYEDFYGYQFPLTGWVAPVKPPLAAAVRMSESTMANIASGGVIAQTALDSCVNNKEAA